MSERYFEDYMVGDEFRTAGVTFTESDIIDYAMRYDPQPFHVDKEAAERSIYGGLIASGWHIVSGTFRMFVQAGILGEASMGSPGLEEVRWLKPVRPGDTLHMTVTVSGTRPSASKADRGYIALDYKILNQRDEVVSSLRGTQIIARRPNKG